MKYNRGAYRRYEFNVNVDAKLNYLIEDYMTGNSLSGLIKELLALHFGIDVDDIYVPFHYRRDENGTMELAANQLDAEN